MNDKKEKFSKDFQNHNVNVLIDIFLVNVYENKTTMLKAKKFLGLP
jgi:hypothetical protein